MNSENWSVQVPIMDLMQIVKMLDGISSIQQENQNLRRELDGLRRVQSEQLEIIGDMRRVLRKLV